MYQLKKFICIIVMMSFLLGGTANVFADSLSKDEREFTIEEVESIVISNMIMEGIINECDVENGLVNIVDCNAIMPVMYYSDNNEQVVPEKAIIIQSKENNDLVSQVVIPMMKDDEGNLVNAISYLSGVPTSRTFSHNASEYSFCTMNISVIYDYYYSHNNGYQMPYYQHGRLLVKFIYDEVIYAPIKNLQVRYISQGYISDANGNSTGTWGETVTTVSQSTVKTNTTYGSTTANNGNLFFIRDISDEVAGNIALSGIAYSFEEKGTTKVGVKPIIFDQNYSEDRMIFYLESEMGWD